LRRERQLLLGGLHSNLNGNNHVLDISIVTNSTDCCQHDVNSARRAEELTLYWSRSRDDEVTPFSPTDGPQLTRTPLLLSVAPIVACVLLQFVTLCHGASSVGRELKSKHQTTSRRRRRGRRLIKLIHSNGANSSQRRRSPRPPHRLRRLLRRS
jgi:hypothetical protein